MSNKHKAQNHNQYSGPQTGDSPENPLHVKLVSRKDENTPETETPAEGSRSTEKPAPRWRLPNWCRNPDWWIVILTFTLSLIGAFTIRYLRIQVNDARDSFRADQRPYIWPANIEKNPTWERTGNNQIGVILHFTNFGKSSAFEVHQIPDLELGENALEKVKTLPLGKYFTIAPTGYEETVAAVSDPLSEKQFTEYTTKNSRMVLYVRFQYKDQSGHLYESDVCSMYYATLQGWAYCPDHNEIKDCSEKTCEP